MSSTWDPSTGEHKEKKNEKSEESSVSDRSKITYQSQLSEVRTEVGATRTTELFLEKVKVDDDICYRVFVHHRDISIREEVLRVHVVIPFSHGDSGGGGGKPKQKTKTKQNKKTVTDHDGLRDVRRGGSICFVLVRVVDLERVHDGREPVDELVEVHARRVFARGRRPVVLGEPEKVVELGVDQGHDARRGARLRLAEGRRGCEANRAPTLSRARGVVCGRVLTRERGGWTVAREGQRERERTEGRLGNVRVRCRRFRSARGW